MPHPQPHAYVTQFTFNLSIAQQSQNLIFVALQALNKVLMVLAL